MHIPRFTTRHFIRDLVLVFLLLLAAVIGSVAFLSARARQDTSQKFIDNANLYPESAELTLITGAQHMYYGSFDGGSYQEEWGPGIEREAMQKIVIDETNEWLAENFPASIY